MALIISIKPSLLSRSGATYLKEPSLAFLVDDAVEHDSSKDDVCADVLRGYILSFVDVDTQNISE